GDRRADGDRYGGAGSRGFGRGCRTRSLGGSQRIARLVDEVPFRGLVARLLGLPERAARLEDQLVSLGPRAAQPPISVVPRLRSLALGVGRGPACVHGRDPRLVQRRGELGPLPPGLAPRLLEGPMQLGAMRLGA